MPLHLPLLLAHLALAPPPPAVPLEQPGQLEVLCADLARVPKVAGTVDRAIAESEHKAVRKEAFQRRFSLTLAPGQFAFREADTETRTLTLDAQRPFRLFGGTAVLHIHETEDIDLQAPEGKPLPPSTLPTKLAITFRPSAEADEACRVGKSQDRAVAIELLTARLLGPQGELLAELIDENAETTVADGKPVVSAQPSLIDGAPALGPAVDQRLAGKVPALDACYAEGIARDPALDGALVYGFELQPGGKVEGLTLLADSVQDDKVAACATSALRGLTWNPESKRAAKAAKGEKAEKGAEKAEKLPALGKAVHGHVTLRFERVALNP